MQKVEVEIQTPRALRPTLKPKHQYKLPKQMGNGDAEVVVTGIKGLSGISGIENGNSLKAKKSSSILFKAHPKTERIAVSNEMVALSELKRERKSPAHRFYENTGRVTNFL